MAKAFSDKRDEISKAVLKGLQAGQANRLREIAIQMSGAKALYDEEVANQLKITEDQQAKMAEVTKATRLMKRQLRTDVSTGTIPVNKYVEKYLAIGKEDEVKTLAVLTEEQRAVFDEMKGAKFDQPERVLPMVVYSRPAVQQPR